MMTGKGTIAFDWRCETCGCTGSCDMRSDEGAYEGGQILIALHRAISPACTGSADTIRVTPRPSVLKQRRIKRNSSGA